MDNKSYSKGISWIDDCRIPFVDGDTTSAGKRTCNIFETEYKSGGNGSPDYITDVRGRFPANILVSDDMLNDGKMYKSGEVKLHHKRNKTLGEYQGNAYGKFNNVNEDLNYESYYGDKGTNSRYYDIDKWFDNLIDV